MRRVDLRTAVIPIIATALLLGPSLAQAQVEQPVAEPDGPPAPEEPTPTPEPLDAPLPDGLPTISAGETISLPQALELADERNLSLNATPAR
jgi:hypothetical protein